MRVIRQSKWSFLLFGLPLYFAVCLQVGNHVADIAVVIVVGQVVGLREYIVKHIDQHSNFEQQIKR